MRKKQFKHLIEVGFVCIVANISLIGQVIPSTEKEFDERYEQNINKEFLYGVYIPKDLSECFSELKRLSNTDALDNFKRASEDLVVKKLHFGLGKWIAYNWNFNEGSRFSHYLKSIGLHDPDDMVQFVIGSFHRHLNGKDLDIDRRVKELQQKRQMIKEKREMEGEVIYHEIRKRKTDQDSTGTSDK